MKNILLIIIITGVLGFGLIASADDVATTTSTTSSQNSSITTLETATRPSISTRTTLSPIAQTRLTNLAANVSNRMDAYVRRISNVTDRLESRANKMSELGYDVTVAKNQIGSARTNLDQAKNELKNIDVAVANFVGSENPRAHWLQVKNTYLKARDAIKEAHRATVDALLLLKTATTIQTSPTATTTESSNNVVE